MLNVHMVFIDDQNDFTDPNGSLYVKGGEENVKRIAKMVERLGSKISDIHLTMDSHHIVDISHPEWWVDENGRHPAPFTGVIAEGDGSLWFFDYAKNAKLGRARTRVISFMKRTTAYIQALTATKRYPHVIWPEHCLIGDPGHNIHPTLAAAVHGWERTRFGVSDTVTKGSNIWTEHFSAVKAEVPDPEDPTTQLNRGLVDTLEAADVVIWAGEALSHCLANTFRDTVANFSDPKIIQKMILCTDGSSNVPGFESYGQTFVSEMRAKGMQVSTTADVLR